MSAIQLPEALSEAQLAGTLAPEAVNPNVVLGDILSALDRLQEARQSYARALTLAKTIEPELQAGWVGQFAEEGGGARSEK